MAQKHRPADQSLLFNSNASCRIAWRDQLL